MPRLLGTETYFATKSIAMASSPLLLCVLLLCSYCLIALGGNERGFVVVPTSTSSPSNPAACSPAPQGTQCNATDEYESKFQTNSEVLYIRVSDF